MSGLSIDNIVSQGAAFGLSAQRAVATVTEQLAQKAEELKTLETAIEVFTGDLRELYDIEVASASLKALVEDYTRQKAELETQQLQARKSWMDELAEHNKTVAQRNKDLEAARAKEQAEYDYKTAQQRQKTLDDFTYMLAKTQRDETDRVALVNKNLATREAVVHKMETDLAEAKARYEGIDVEIKKASEAAVAIATNSVKKDLEGKFALEKKDLESGRVVQNERNVALQMANDRLSAENAKLQTQVEAAKNQVTEITIKALEAQSGQQALGAVRDMAKDLAPAAKGK